ncbi:Uncharacterised protein [Mycobacteroides abscessus subsp. abscessus]|nr:Uncharacterised protein [Mycobacteroides abscessus subsp. abscessus]
MFDVPPDHGEQNSPDEHEDVPPATAVGQGRLTQRAATIIACDEIVNALIDHASHRRATLCLFLGNAIE